MAVRGSARCTGSSGLGDTAAFIPAGGGAVREALPVSWLTRRRRGAGVHGACAKLFQHPLPARDLAKNRPRVRRRITPPTTEIEGARGVLGERNGGAFTSQ